MADILEAIDERINSLLSSCDAETDLGDGSDFDLLCTAKQEIEHLRNPRPPHTPVVLLVHPDGWLELYGPKHVWCECRMVPEVPKAGEKDAEEFVELSLPPKYREVVRPDYRKLAVKAERLRPSDIIYRKWIAGAVRRLVGTKYEADS